MSKEILILLLVLGLFFNVTAQNTVNKDKKVLTFKIRKNTVNSSTIEVYTIVEQMPLFPEGDVTMQQFIARTIQYPENAREAGIQGTVYISFVVAANGVIEDAKVLRGVNGSKELDEEALRVVKSMPRWTPGRQSGRPVAVQYNIPIKFSLR